MDASSLSLCAAAVPELLKQDKNAWPVVGATFVLLHTKQDKSDQGEETLKFFDWAFSNGDQAAEELGYIPLPDSVVTEIRSQWSAKMKDASGKPVAEQ